MNKKDFAKAATAVGRYSQTKEDFRYSNRLYAFDIYGGVAENLPLSKKQAALAIVIHNSAEKCWYWKSRNRGMGCNIETPAFSKKAWSRMARKFLSCNPDFNPAEWSDYLCEDWPDNESEL